MSTDLESITASFGLVRREFRDVHAVVSRLDHQVRRLVEPVAIHRPAGLVARHAACKLIALKEKRWAEAIAKQHFADDRDLAHLIELKAAVTSAMTTVSGWATELAAVVVVDIATNLLPASALAQLRAASGQDYAFIDGAVARVPVHTPTPSGGFVAESGVIPVGALIIAALGLKPKKAASITAITKELAAGSPLNVELSLRTLLAQDLGLAIDNVLLSSTAATSAAPAGLLNGVTPLTATAGGGGNALLGDIRKLLAAIAPAIRPVLITNSVQAASIATLSQAPLPVIAAPYLPADQIIAVDAAAFASSLGAPDFSTDENPTVHMESTAPLPIATPGSPPTIAAPTQSLWKTAAIGLRCLIDCDWTLRRAGAVSTITGVTW
jgi:hypothetical protein